MDELNASMKIALANTFVMYFQSHSYHWNVEGPNFTQYHEFLNGLYEDLHGAVDPIAEHIRALDAYAPISIADVLSAATIAQDTAKPATPIQMFSNLLSSNTEVVAALQKAADHANSINNQGLLNFLADRLDTHAKHAWMLKSLLK